MCARVRGTSRLTNREMVKLDFGGSEGGGLGEKFKVYLGLQCVWWVGTYAIIYRFQPTVRLMATVR